jgi:hypothetical protein
VTRLPARLGALVAALALAAPAASASEPPSAPSAVAHSSIRIPPPSRVVSFAKQRFSSPRVSQLAVRYRTAKRVWNVLTIQQRTDRYCRAIFNFFGSEERWQGDRHHRRHRRLAASA